MCFEEFEYAYKSKTYNYYNPYNLIDFFMNKNLFFLLILSVFLQSCSSDDETKVTQNDTTAFIDNFEFFDTSVWTKEIHEAGWTNNELQSYDEDHVSIGVDEGKSVLMITAERKGDRIMSGRINSRGKKNFKYGRVEASIKLPNLANGLWPAFWLMGDNEKQWPACGEIDVMEMGSQVAIEANMVETMLNTAIHYGANVAGHRQEFYNGNATVSLLDGKYHKYALERDEYSLNIYVDDVKFHSFDISKASGRSDYFQDNFFFLFNLAVGGDFTGILDADGVTALKDGEKAVMYVDWIKISY